MGFAILTMTVILLSANIHTRGVVGGPISFKETEESQSSEKYVEIEIRPYAMEEFIRNSDMPTMYIPYKREKFTHDYDSNAYVPSNTELIFDDEVGYPKDEVSSHRHHTRVKSVSTSRSPILKWKKIGDMEYGDRFLAKSVASNGCSTGQVYSKIHKRCLRKYSIKNRAAVG